MTNPEPITLQSETAEQPCPHHTTDSETVWEYGTPDSSGWERRCKLCGQVQVGSIPCP
jgi:hypothetical protein